MYLHRPRSDPEPLLSFENPKSIYLDLLSLSLKLEWRKGMEGSPEKVREEQEPSEATELFEHNISTSKTQLLDYIFLKSAGISDWALYIHLPFSWIFI